MPLYEYKCQQCGKVSEFFMKLSDPTPDSCPGCAAPGTLEKIVSRTHFQLKGQGWYETDFKKKPATEARTDTPSAKSEPASAAEPASPPTPATTTTSE